MPTLKSPGLDLYYEVDHFTDPWTQPETIRDSRLLVLPGNSYHVAATDPERCAQATLDFVAGHRITASPEP
ncbi:MAG: hypothetical protein ABI547_01825 [Betaproteobacteria bacterium]